MKVPFNDLRQQHRSLLPAIRQAIDAVIAEAAFSGGVFVAKFEQAFADYCQVRHAVGVGSGTDALWLALQAVGVRPGDEVITVASTFIATAEAITRCGAHPVFVEIDPASYTLDPTKLEPAITARTRAIVPVHLFGQPADMDPILAIARRHGLAVVEDACQAHGARYQGRPVGTLGDAGCFSFYPGKNLGALGEAGCVVTHRADVAESVHLVRNHGQRARYDHVLVGWNARMDGIQAAVLSVKLEHLDRENELRRRHAATYNELLRGGPIVLPAVAQYARPAHHIYAVRVARRDAVLAAMAAAGVACGVHYPVPVHRLPAYAGLGLGVGSLPVTEHCAASFLSLPMYPALSSAQIEYVATQLQECVQGCSPPLCAAA